MSSSPLELLIIGTDFFPLFQQTKPSVVSRGYQGGTRAAGMSLHLEQIYISLPDPHRCRRAAGVRQTPTPAPTCTGRGLLRQQHALFNRYLTHLTLPPARHCRRARPRVRLLLGWDFAAAGFMGRPRPPALASGPAR